jgi:hypothetical protein
MCAYSLGKGDTAEPSMAVHGTRLVAHGRGRADTPIGFGEDAKPRASLRSRSARWER